MTMILWQYSLICQFLDADVYFFSILSLHTFKRVKNQTQRNWFLIYCRILLICSPYISWIFAPQICSSINIPNISSYPRILAHPPLLNISPLNLSSLWNINFTINVPLPSSVFMHFAFQLSQSVKTTNNSPSRQLTDQSQQ